MKSHAEVARILRVGIADRKIVRSQLRDEAGINASNRYAADEGSIRSADTPSLSTSYLARFLAQQPAFSPYVESTRFESKEIGLRRTLDVLECTRLQGHSITERGAA